MIADPGTALSLGCLDESRQVTLPYRGWRSDESKAFSGVVTVERREEFREWLGHRIVENSDDSTMAPGSAPVGKEQVGHQRSSSGNISALFLPYMHKTFRHIPIIIYNLQTMATSLAFAVRGRRLQGQQYPAHNHT